MNEITISELLKINPNNIIDIRDNYSYNLGHLRNAINIPYYSLDVNYSIYLDKNKPYYFYCDFGKQSQKLSYKLNNLGYNTYYVKEGYLDFQNIIK